MLAKARGRPLRFIDAPGQTGDVTKAPALPCGHQDNAVLADKAYDSRALRTLIADMGAEAVIPSNRCRNVAIHHHVTVYNYETVSSDVSDASSTSDDLPHGTTAEPYNSPASYTSPLQ